MSFLAVLLALIVEQIRPLQLANPVHAGFLAWARWAGVNFDAGRERHAWVVWSVTVIAPALMVSMIFVLLDHYSVVLALGWDLVVLYFTLGFRQFSHYFTDIRDALEQGREDEARALLRDWRHLDASELPRTELLRHVIEHALLAAHRHVFGVFFWFVLGSACGLGPLGAVLYRMAEFGSRYWGHKQAREAAPTSERLMRRFVQLFEIIDFVPVRLTAAGFAVVGNFEESVGSWRQYANLWADRNVGVLLAAASGACGVALGGQRPQQAQASPAHSTGMMPLHPITAPLAPDDEQSSTAGAPPQFAHLRSVVGLVWRSVVLWLLLLAQLSLANLLG
ncbi:CobD/CbiB family protein [Leptothrix ochracea]|uniref:CobD/CbiB family protein n=1 Tax=Leptothrix ochracea TaxID=735331 RepID=UPI0034E1A992